MTDNLFRSGALNARRNEWLGQILIVRPLSFSVFTSLSLIFLLIFIIFTLYGSFTKRVAIPGQLMPSTGLIKVQPRQSGVVVSKWISEGVDVKKGDKLYEISAERFTNYGNLENAIVENAKRRVISYEHQISTTQLSSSEEVRAILEKISARKKNIEQIDLQISSQRQRLTMAEDADSRYKNLLKQNFVSAEMGNQKIGDMLEQSSKLQSLIREKISIQQDIEEYKNSILPLKLKTASQIEQLQREVEQAKQELLEGESKKNLVIVSPTDGRATGAIMHIGQAVTSNTTLVSIIPKNAVLQAFLYSESKYIGFIKQGDKVNLRYQAFPYEKFGLSTGRVSSVSRSVLSKNDLDSIYYSVGSQAPLYQITVELDSQGVQAYGESVALQPGMLLTGDVKQETRKVWEWILEPLLGITKKVKNGE